MRVIRNFDKNNRNGRRKKISGILFIYYFFSAIGLWWIRAMCGCVCKLFLMQDIQIELKNYKTICREWKVVNVICRRSVIENVIWMHEMHEEKWNPTQFGIEGNQVVIILHISHFYNFTYMCRECGVCLCTSNAREDCCYLHGIRQINMKSK